MIKKEEEYYALSRKTLIAGIVIVIIAAVLAGVYFKGGFDKYLGKNETKTAEPLPKFELIAIENPACTECMNASQAMEIIKGAPVLNVTSDRIISFDSAEAKKLITKYEIERLPAFILKGKNLDAKLTPFEKKKDALVFGRSPPVYYDIKKDKIVGEVTVIAITKPSCEKCFDITKLVAQLKNLGMAIVSEQIAEYNSTTGKALIKEYNITKIPTMILSEEAIEYDALNKSWKDIGSIEKDGKLVLRTVNAPYYDLSAKKTKGLVDITYLKDEECTECYSPAQFKSYFQQSLGMAFDTETTVDISSSEGKSLVKKYNITLVPTALFSNDLKEYPAIKQMWSQMGKVVNGTYVFTKVDKLQGIKYKDLSTGEILGEGPKEIKVNIGNQTQ